MGNHREMFNRAIGVTAEFDPFHLGHQYLLQQAREKYPQKGLICCMSGSFTQRGSAAACDKFRRAEMALHGGADLVVELPVLWSTASAETFARGAVGLLLDTGVVDTIAFGSESGDLAQLRRTAAALDSQAAQQLIRQGLEKGLSYAAARQQAAETLLGHEGSCLSGANNTLGVEYLRALSHWGAPETQVFTVSRRGHGHNSTEESHPMVSASKLRSWMTEGDWDRLPGSLPEISLRLLSEEQRKGRCPAQFSRLELGILARLRTMEEGQLAQLPDCADGLEKRLARAARESVTLAEFYNKAKTRCYPEARIRRMTLWAMLNLTPEQRPERVPYLRVLGFNRHGRSLLKEIKERTSLPILTKPAQVRRLEPEARQVFALECRATDLWNLCLPEPQQRIGGSEWLRSPVILSEVQDEARSD